MITTIQQIKPDFDAVIQYSQNIPFVKTERLLEQWYSAKKHIIDTWNGKLIVESEHPVTFELSPEDKKQRLDEFISTVEDVYGNSNLATFLSDIENDFFSNHLSMDYICYHTDEAKIPKGTKIVKAFKYFEDNEKALYDLQTQASMIIQEDKVCGKLCMSVHPLDFLSSSENTYHWRSCHSLDGDYRAGNLSYMLDKSTIVCYLKNDDKLYKLPNFPESVHWNSKKWRMLLFLEDEIEALFAGRQYPFSSPNALQLIQKMFLKFWQKGERYWSDWMDDYITEFPRKNYNYRDCNLYYGGRYVALNGRIYGMDDLVTDAKRSRHYNDLKFSSFYIPMYCYTYYPKNNNRRLHFSIGSEVPCLYCENQSIDMEASMVCVECGAELGEGEDDYYVYCGCCQHRVPRETTIWNCSIEEYVCSECYERECRDCGHCEETWYSSDMIYSSSENAYLCPCCNERLKQNRVLSGPQEPFVTIDFDNLLQHLRRE